MTDPTEVARASGDVKKWDPMPEILERAEKHLVIVWAAAAFVIYVVKVLIEVRGSPEAALAVMQGGSTLAVMLALGATLLPQYVGMTVVVVLYYAVLTRWSAATIFGLFVVGTATVLISPWWLATGYLIVLPLTMIIAFLYGRRQALRWAAAGDPRLKEGRSLRESSRTTLGLLLLGLMVGGFLVLIMPGMWVPAERLRLADGTEHVAYVVGIADGWATLVDADDRSVRRIPAVTLVSRTICSTRSTREQTIPEVLGLSRSVAPPPCTNP